MSSSEQTTAAEGPAWSAGASGGVAYWAGFAAPAFQFAAAIHPPTTLLLFGQPQRVPPLRLLLGWYGDLPFGYWSSRSPAGASVAGVLLRATDPAEQAALGARNSRSLWLRRASAAAFTAVLPPASGSAPEGTGRPLRHGERGDGRETALQRPVGALRGVDLAGRGWADGRAAGRMV